ncbi:MAG TPA: hypothetical protein VJ813_10480 [Vicinamibacterales bacterium]|nr:hypothetical protein [Vicinamibacterales bacterium]
MTSPADPRKAAESCIKDLITIVQQQPAGDARTALLQECEALARAIAAFHMEGIRFRAFNVDRLLQKGTMELPPAAGDAFAQMRRHLDEAGFHTRSHQSPV